MSFEPWVDQAMLKRKLKEKEEEFESFNRTSPSTGSLNREGKRGDERREERRGRALKGGPS